MSEEPYTRIWKYLDGFFPFDKKPSGFYMVGFFSKGRKCGVSFRKEKPFEIDTLNGEINPKCICVWPAKARKPHNEWPEKWLFIIGSMKKELSDKDKKNLNEIWERWCKEYKRKYSPIFDIKGGENDG